MSRPLRAYLRHVRPWTALVLVAGVVALGAGLASRHRALPAPCPGTDHACALPASPRPARAQDIGESELPPGAAVVEFTSEACPACRRMEPVLRDAREQCLTAGAGIVRVDVESATGAGFAARLNITGTPTLVLFDAAHEEVARLVGARSLADVRQTLEQAYGIACARPTIAPRPSG